MRVFSFCRVGTAATQASASTSVIWSVDPVGLLLPRGRFARASRSPGGDLIFRYFLVPYTKDQNQIRGHPFACEQKPTFHRQSRPPRQGFSPAGALQHGGIDGCNLHKLRCPRIEVSSASWTEVGACFAVQFDASHLEGAVRPKSSFLMPGHPIELPQSRSPSPESRSFRPEPKLPPPPSR